MPSKQTNAYFINNEGIDGSGKTTQVRFIEEYLLSEGIPHIKSREPGGTLLGEELRKILLHRKGLELSPEQLTLLFYTARDSYMREIVRPNLEQGVSVLSDRFDLSTMAYQGYGAFNGDTKKMNFLLELSDFVVRETRPDLTFLYRVPLSVAHQRMSSTERDRMESMGDEFMQRVIDGYDVLTRKSSDDIVVVDASINDPQIIFDEQVRPYIDRLFLAAHLA